MLNNQKENKEFLGKEETGFAAVSDEGIMPLVDSNIEGDVLKVRKIPQRLAAKMAGINVGSTYEPIINNQTDAAAYQNALSKIRGNHSVSFSDDDCHIQAPSECARYALATALSINGVKKNGRKIQPQDIDAGVTWANYGATRVAQNRDCFDLTENEILLSVDAQLTMGRPVIVQCRKNWTDLGQHWAVVVAKSGSQYTVIDPAKTSSKDTTCFLTNMEYYTSSIGLTGYVILSENLY